MKKMSYDIQNLSPEELSSKYGQSFKVDNIGDTKIYSICSDSHSSMFGGNMIFLFPDGKIHQYMGHVCGGSFSTGLVLRYKVDSKNENIEPSSEGFYQFLKKKYRNTEN